MTLGAKRGLRRAGHARQRHHHLLSRLHVCESVRRGRHGRVREATRSGVAMRLILALCVMLAALPALAQEPKNQCEIIERQRNHAAVTALTVEAELLRAREELERAKKLIEQLREQGK